MAAQMKALIENGRVNIKLGAKRILEDLPVDGKEKKVVLDVLNSFRMISIREFLEQSEDDFKSHYKASENMVATLKTRLTELGLHFGMTPHELSEYSKTGKVLSSQSQQGNAHIDLPNINNEGKRHLPGDELDNDEWWQKGSIGTTSNVRQNPSPSTTPVMPEKETRLQKPSSPSGSSVTSADTPVKPGSPTAKSSGKKKTIPENKPKAKAGNPSPTSYEKPYGDKEKTRRNMMFFRVSDDELASIQAGADACDMKISAYVRELVLGKTPRAAMTDEERKLFMDLREMLTNLRQMRNYFNKDRKDPQVWKKLTTVVNFMNDKIQDMKS